ncbi:hypothetical protein PUNSTDRAFT_137926 [Punctularia strigosozonata HHB-11173 SS5]|uniref:Uncharacterized protein n=1 Tax=Punctularia strigosozonata (strain HHB-11173) TaxID=741275 RepID=R7S5H5_PUNST|nr:uncharacterized protein PUNSTDRAFT_137926 [Punctularia strigosozonata HHB-11173 SS5]EIN05244.1 hypothetical protein PUNSTDRAFT_137926 [Punctularia strigosozonata HHB-11173 SS5]
MPPWAPRDNPFNKPHYRLNRAALVELVEALGVDPGGNVHDLKARTKQALLDCKDELIDHPSFTALYTDRENNEHLQGRVQDTEDEDSERQGLAETQEQSLPSPTYELAKAADMLGEQRERITSLGAGTGRDTTAPSPDIISPFLGTPATGPADSQKIPGHQSTNHEFGSESPSPEPDELEDSGDQPCPGRGAARHPRLSSTAPRAAPRQQARHVNEFPTVHASPIPLSSRGRPARVAGVVADVNYYVIPQQICDIFERGHRRHVPLHHLMDAACMAQGINTNANLANLWQIESGGLVPVQQPLSPEGEMQLSFAEWLQAWQRYLQLFEEYLPHEYLDWFTHHENIRLRRGVSSENVWPVWLAYDIEIRRRWLNTPIDPRKHHCAIWDDLYIAHLGRRVLQPHSPGTCLCTKN